LEVFGTYEEVIQQRDVCLAAVSLAESEHEARLYWRRAKGLQMVVRKYRADRAPGEGDAIRSHAHAGGSGSYADVKG